MHDRLPSRLMLADSFLVEHVGGVAEVRAFDRHAARFAAGLQQLGVTTDIVTFMEVAVLAIREYVRENGDAFPRLECWETASGPHLTIALRPAPTRTSTVAFTPAMTPVIDASASLKGPNIERYAALTAEYRGEVLLTTLAGDAIEGTTTSLVWWEGDTLMTVAPGIARVPSITESLVLDIAHELGYPTETAVRPVDEVLATELWAVNALHGIRPASSHRSARLARFTARYAASTRPLEWIP